jgi:CubicO group peptidase (beta-lactamase class C family)
MSKIVSVTAVMHLVEQGRVALDDDMREIVPQLATLQILKGFDEAGKPILEDNTKPVTLRHLLTHGAGMGIDLADPDLMRWSAAIGRKTHINTHTLEGWTVPLRFAPGDGWYYGVATDWAGVALETITGQTLAEYMGRYVLQPLGMGSTTFYRNTIPHRAPCTMRNALTGAVSVVPTIVPAEPPRLSAGAGLYSSAGDFIKLLQGLLKVSAGEGGILKKETADEMFRPQLSPAQRGVLKFVSDMYRKAQVPEFEEGMPLDHGISGIINLEDSKGKRRKGSMMWQGMCNSHWVSALTGRGLWRRS